MKKSAVLLIFFISVFVARATEMDEAKYVVESEKTVDQATESLKTAAKNHGFGILAVHDMTATLKKKGFDLSNQVRVFELCNPKSAYTVLSSEISLNMLLPCRISVYTVNGKTMIGMVRPTVLLGLLIDNKKLTKFVQDIEDSLVDVINESK